MEPIVIGNVLQGESTYSVFGAEKEIINIERVKKIGMAGQLMFVAAFSFNTGQYINPIIPTNNSITIPYTSTQTQKSSRNKINETQVFNDNYTYNGNIVMYKNYEEGSEMLSKLPNNATKIKLKATKGFLNGEINFDDSYEEDIAVLSPPLIPKKTIKLRTTICGEMPIRYDMEG